MVMEIVLMRRTIFPMVVATPVALLGAVATSRCMWGHVGDKGRLGETKASGVVQPDEVMQEAKHDGVRGKEGNVSSGELGNEKDVEKGA